MMETDEVHALSAQLEAANVELADQKAYTQDFMRQVRRLQAQLAAVQAERDAFISEIRTLKASADGVESSRRAGRSVETRPGEIETLWRGKSIAYETTLGVLARIRKESGQAPVARGEVVTTQEQFEIVRLCTEYLSNGGLFNPELMDHDKVHHLILRCRTALR